jgi:molybdopterin-containing oxidoreductase family iron-sulfur binding subunit
MSENQKRIHLRVSGKSGGAGEPPQLEERARTDFARADVRRRLEGAQGRAYWKSLEELAGDPAVEEMLRREFPEQASVFDDPRGRRQFLNLMGASLALAGLTACTRQPDEKIVPYVKPPEEVVPGRPLFFATAVLDGGYAKGVLVESHLGRPTKIEGNPDHPASLGATDTRGQASLLDLYDPDRSQTLTYLGEIRAWGTFLASMKSALDAQRPQKGAGIRLLTETVTSPTLAAQIKAFLAEFPAAKWHQWEPAGRDAVRAGAMLAFGQPLETQYHFAAADVILSLDADFVSEGPATLRHIREFSSRRKLEGGKKEMNRLYAVECTPTLAGSLADHRLPLRPSEVEHFARAVAALVGAGAEAGAAFGPGSPRAAWVGALAKDLQAHAGSSLVIAGEYQPPVVHALAHAINAKLGNVGRTVVYTAPVEANPVDQLASMKELAADMDRGVVSLLVVLKGNPVFTAPADLDFAAKVDKVPLRVHLGLQVDETAERCHWQVPEAHPLEAWSDARAFDGTVTLLQPLIAPLYPSARSAHEVLAALSPRPERSGYDLLREFWSTQPMGADIEKSWRRALHDGVVAGQPALAPVTPAVSVGDWSRPTPRPAAAGLEVAFRPDPTVHDGRYANNGWLQELPKPLTKLTWDNAALMGPETARSLGVSIAFDSLGHHTDVVEIRLDGRSVKAPAWVVPGHPEGSLTLHLGYGRQRAGRVGTGAGFDAYALRTSAAPWWAAGAEVRRTGERYRLACTQDHWSMEGRPIVRAASLEEYERNPSFAHEIAEEPPSEMTLYPKYSYDGHKWGMSIDLNSCVGCNACMSACQAENNVPVVGKDQVAKGREMHWIRIDRYYAGDPAKPESVETYHQPLPCMQCENAPCEVVCPVAATVHSDEGLNDMVYNRCVGTRYCSNNCPYKVRRFNFFLYQDWTTPTFKLMRNPEVTVRSRGVMEKCTYCVQRINHARINARNEGRPIKDGEIKTACQEVCPAEAIIFGDLNDPESRVSRLKAEPRNYSLLAELNTRPRTTYLAAVRNPNPEMPNV